jgi:hypothetical protein
MPPVLDHPTVAVCAVGAARTLVLPHVYQSIKHNLTLALTPQGADLFLHVHLHPDFYRGSSHRGHFLYKKDDPHLLAAIAYLRPAQLEIIENSSCSALESKFRAGCNAVTRVESQSSRNPRPIDTPALSASLQYAWTARCFHAVFKHEGMAGQLYTWVIRTRPDLAFFATAPSVLILPATKAIYMQKESFPPYFDGFFMLPRSLATPMAEALLRFHSAAISFALTISPEAQFFPWVQRQYHLSWMYKPIPAVIVRNDRLECFRLVAYPELLRTCGAWKIGA